MSSYQDTYRTGILFNETLGFISFHTKSPISCLKSAFIKHLKSDLAGALVYIQKKHL